MLLSYTNMHIFEKMKLFSLPIVVVLLVTVMLKTTAGCGIGLPQNRKFTAL